MMSIVKSFGVTPNDVVELRFSEASLNTILPIIERDLPRAQLMLWPSMERHLNLRGHHVVVTPEHEFQKIKNGAPSWCEVLPESKILPKFQSRFDLLLLKIASRTGEFHPLSATYGWWRQQLIKLYASDLFPTGHYLCLDADLVVAPSAASTVAFRDGRSLWQESEVQKTSEPTNEHQPTWFENAHRALQIDDPGGESVQVTPCFLAHDGIESLRLRFIEKAPHHELLVRVAMHKRRQDWMSAAISLLPWTEFAIYCEWLRHTGEFKKFHFTSSEHRVYGPSLWRDSALDEWHHAVKVAPYNFAFIVAQSNRNDDIHWVSGELRRAGLIE